MRGYFILIEISDADLIDLLAGRKPEVEVGVLPHEVRNYLGCSRDTVYLTQHSLLHILQRHGDHVAPEDIRLAPEVMMRGLWLSDDRPNFAVVSCLVDELRFRAVVKTTVDRRRNYLSTFHRMAKRQTRSLLKRGTVLRQAW